MGAELCHIRSCITPEADLALCSLDAVPEGAYHGISRPLLEGTIGGYLSGKPDGIRGSLRCGDDVCRLEPCAVVSRGCRPNMIKPANRPVLTHDVGRTAKKMRKTTCVFLMCS
jgi:hypothetical protein